MKALRPPPRRSRVAFTLVEMLVVMAIIALLASLVIPSFSQAIMRAKSAQCASNLSSIGLAVSQAAADNGNAYPEINQVAGASPYPTGSGAKDLYDTLSPYGITSNSLQCPVDVANGATSYYKLYGSSYEWDPILDDGNPANALVYVTPMFAIPVNDARVHLCFDFTPVHSGHSNVLFGDGHVRSH
jgi:prepilin-type N-terminal cleavage/methylation domain-containing protein/prepilin-type processing-associated H-X9-DG protein